MKPVPAADPARRHAVTYARLSSKEQEKEGFSIPAQLKLPKEYAAAQGFAVGQEYVDVETAKQTGRKALKASHADQRREHQEVIARLRAEHKRLGDRINAMDVDKLDGKIGGDFYDRFAGEWRDEQLRLQRETDRHEAAEQSYMEEGVQILELARNAQTLFARQEPRQRHRLLNFILSNCSREDGLVRATFRQPFDLLAETTAIVARREAASTDSSAKNDIWLGDVDSNHD